MVLTFGQFLSRLWAAELHSAAARRGALIPIDYFQFGEDYHWRMVTYS
jgi:hypothetical protein